MYQFPSYNYNPNAIICVGVPSYSRPKPGYIKPTLPNLTAPQQYIPGDVPYPGGMQHPNQQRDPNPHLVNLPQEKEYVPPKLPPSHRQHPTTVPNPPNPFVGEQDIRRFGDSGASPNVSMLTKHCSCMI